MALASFEKKMPTRRGEALMQRLEFNRMLIPLFVVVTVGAQPAAAEVAVERSKNGALVKIDGKVFAEYLIRSGHQPAVRPIIGPTGKAMTRWFPAPPLREGEMTDHPHHQSMWFAHGDVNGKDFWTSNEESLQNNEIKHREFVTTNGGTTGTIVTRNDWMSEGKKICEDERTLVFGQDEFGRYIDFLVTIAASEGPLEFGDTKEGTFGLRANTPLTVDAKKGAHIVNDSGQKDEQAWGMFANWIDDYGPVDGEVVGIALFSHPKNFRHPTRWHARSYGLLAANPFGEVEFPQDAGHAKSKQGVKTLAGGEKLSLRYLVLLHSGNPQEANVRHAYEKFIAPTR
jgi:Methane oxygenase PmoA